MNFEAFSPTIGHLAYLFILMSYMVRKIFLLRILAICASIFSISYSLFVLPNPLWISVQWNSLFIAINIIHLLILLWEKREITFKGDEKILHDQVFSHLTSGDFKKLPNLSKITTYSKNSILIEEDICLDKIFVVIEGALGIRKNDKEIAELGKGSFAGEMSFLTGDLTRAYVIAKTNSRVCYWNQKELKEFLLLNPELQSSFQMILGSQLINELMTSSVENAYLKAGHLSKKPDHVTVHTH